MPSFTQGATRERIDAAEALALQSSGALVTDARRTRPLYFDGRFLAARDLTRDQNYFLMRQADLGRAGGAGVVHGLLVAEGAVPTLLTIGAGHGITPAGELVILDTDCQVNLLDLASSQRLNAAFGLLRIPHEPARTRSGLFVVALRPVEYSANPIAAYPTAIDEQRSVHDGDIVEATAITLIPYADGGDGALDDQRRSQLARDIFVTGGARGLPTGVLPLAMVALERGSVVWVDPFLVRRDVGAEHGAVLGLGLTPRALREAHLIQYDRQFGEILSSRGPRGPRFAATEYFRALPAAGQMPAATINPQDWTQMFFPPEVEVTLSFVPADEVQALVEESVLLPPIDLALSGDDLTGIAVLALIPVTRQRFWQLRQSLGEAASPLQRVLPAAAPNLLARRRPLDVLRGLHMPRLPLPPLNPQEPVDALWNGALFGEGAPATLIYVRRRNLAYRAEITGTAVLLDANELDAERALNQRLKDQRLESRVARLRSVASTPTRADVVQLLAAPKFADSRTLLNAAIRELEAAKTTVTPDPAMPDATEERLARSGVATVAERFGDPRLGEGLARLQGSDAALAEDKVVSALADSGAVPELDRVARTLAPPDLTAFAAELLTTARGGSAIDLAALIRRKDQELRR